MSSNTEPVILFNVTNGSLAIGDAAMEAAIDSGEQAHDLLQISKVLLDNTIELGVGNEGFGRKYDLTPDELINYGKWISSIVQSVDPSKWTTDAILQRAYKMGLGPGPRYISARFNNNLWRFRDAVGETGGWTKQKYESWGRQEFVEYGKTVAVAVKRKPTTEDFHLWFKRGHGPSPSYIKNRVGSITVLQELLGYPDITNWDEQDYINYGTRFCLANPDIKPTAVLIDQLSKQKRGPSAKAIHVKFGSLSAFQGIVEEQAAEERIFAADAQEAKKRQYLAEIEVGELPSEILDEQYENVKQFIATIARYKVARRLLRGISETEVVGLSRRATKSFVLGITRRSEGLIKAGAIENTALLMDLFDDIWPLDDYLKYLKVEKPERKKPEKKFVESTEVGLLTLINLKTGEVVYAENHDGLEEFGDNPTYVPLGEILASSDPVPNHFGTRKKLPYKDWGLEQNITYAKWINSLVTCPDGLPTRDVFRKAYRLGLGPGEGRISTLFGNYRNFQLLSAFQPEHAASWSRETYTQYGFILQRATNQPPTTKDIERWSKKEFGPSLEDIVSVFGSVENFMETIGYPQTTTWDKDDFIEWGIQVMKANPGKVVDRRVVAPLSKTRRGPSFSQIVGTFGNIETWLETLTTSYAEQCQVESESNAELIATFDSRLEAGEFPVSLLNSGKPDSLEKVRRMLAYDVIQKLNIKISSDKCGEIAAVSPQLYLASILRAAPHIKPDAVEAVAMELEFTDIIWPRNEFLNYLKLHV